MNYPDKFKQGFINQIEKELNKCEIIYNPNTKGIWFVNREEKYWYLEYKVESNYLWWRYEFFKSYTDLFSMDDKVFEKVISEWVEETLNCKVLTTHLCILQQLNRVEATLNCKVVTTGFKLIDLNIKVEDTLNCKVLTTSFAAFVPGSVVEDTLNCKVLSTGESLSCLFTEVEDTLN